jgi:protoporphyrinogen oxidase
VEHGFSLNRGPHALYLNGPATEVLNALGVRYSGHRPPVDGALAVRGGQLHTLPRGLVSLLTTGLLRLPEKLVLARFLSRLATIDAAQLDGTPLSVWLDGAYATQGTRELAAALLRLSTYCADADRLSAGAAIRQLRAECEPWREVPGRRLGHLGR